MKPPKREPRSYQGRPLARPDEELVDQGLAFDVTTLLSRRGVLLAGAGALAAGLAGCAGSGGGGASSSASGSGGGVAEFPPETAGPYPGDGSNGADVLERSGVVREDIRSSFGGGGATAKGVPMRIELTVLNLAEDNAGYKGAAVYVWHCDREGRYSMYSEGVENENYLRGVQIADTGGSVAFTSVFPACYAGRWPHVHFEVYPDEASIAEAGKAVVTSQLALPRDVCETVYAEAGYEDSVRNLSQVSLDGDNVFGDDGGEYQLAKVTGSVAKGYTVSLSGGVDPS